MQPSDDTPSTSERVEFIANQGRLEMDDEEGQTSSSHPMPGRLPQQDLYDEAARTENRSKNFAQFTLAGLAVPLLIVNRDGTILEWNGFLEHLTGVASKDVRDLPLESLIENSYRAEWRKTWERTLRNQSCETCELSFTRHDESLIYFRTRAMPYSTHEDGIPTSVVCILEQITSPCGTQQEDPPHDPETLRIKDFPLPTLSISTVDATVLGWNPAMEELTGCASDEIVGKELSSPIVLKYLHMAEIFETGFRNGKYSSTINSHGGRQLSVDVETKCIENNEKMIVVVKEKVQRIQGASSVAGSSSAAGALEFRRLIDTANTPMFGLDENGNIDVWNEKMAEITGYSNGEALNAPFVETFLSHERKESMEKVLHNALAGRSMTNFDLIVNTKFDGVRYLQANISCRRDAKNITGVFVVAHDMTEASRRDQAVDAMAGELRLLIDTANAPIFGIDCDGDVNEWNEQTVEVTGYTKEEAFDCSLVQTFIVPKMQASVQDVLDTALQGIGTANYELEFRTKSQEIRHLLVNATTRRDNAENVVGVVGVAQDVTHAVQRDRAVAGVALELRQLIDTANAPIFGIDIDGNVNEWNRRTQDITGFSKEETFDEPLVEKFIAQHMRQRVHQILDAALQGDETSNYELEFVSKSGEPRFMLVNACARRDPEGDIVGVVGVGQDITEDRKHEEELRKLHYLQVTQEAKVETERNMTAYFAHELRNPLGAIDSALNAMPEDLPESAKSLIAGMQLCSSFMSSIMNNLLDVRKMEEGKMQLNKVPLSLAALLKGVHKMLLPSVKRGVKFECESLTDGRDWVLGDEHRTQQVLTNVITNAIKYTVSGHVRISLCWEDDLVKFECSDTGPGIPKSEQEKMFERFVQRGGAPGTGLGLAIAKHLVDLTGGNIKFQSDPSVRPGTTCIVRMPLTLCEPPGGGDVDDELPDPVETGLLQEPLTFFIIDDVEMNRKMFKRRIEKGIAPNCKISQAATGEEALQICAEETFDVIIVDQYMEEAGGIMVGTDVVYAMRRMQIDSIIIGCSGNDLNKEFSEAGAGKLLA